jgi:hypothetical protein
MRALNIVASFCLLAERHKLAVVNPSKTAVLKHATVLFIRNVHPIFQDV